MLIIQIIVFFSLDKKKPKKIEKLRKSRHTSSDEAKSDKSRAESSSGSEDEKKTADKNKKARDSSRSGTYR